MLILWPLLLLVLMLLLLCSWGLGCCPVCSGGFHALVGDLNVSVAQVVCCGFEDALFLAFLGVFCYLWRESGPFATAFLSVKRFRVDNEPLPLSPLCNPQGFLTELVEVGEHKWLQQMFDMGGFDDKKALLARVSRRFFRGK